MDRTLPARRRGALDTDLMGGAWDDRTAGMSDEEGHEVGTAGTGDRVPRRTPERAEATRDRSRDDSGRADAG